jgi:hypothetical protein
MRLQAQPVNVVSILGNDYSIKAPEGQEETLAQAVRMLNVALAETKRSTRPDRRQIAGAGGPEPVLETDRVAERTARPWSAPRRRSTPRSMPSPDHRRPVKRSHSLWERVYPRSGGFTGRFRG